MLPEKRNEIMSVNDCREKVYDLFNNCGVSIEYRNRSVIGHGGGPSNYIYLVKSGCVVQSFIGRCGNMKTILILSHGDLFGEVTLFHNDIDLVITQAFVNTSIIKIPSQVFLTALKKNPEYYYYISVMISNKFKILMAQLHDSSFFDVSLRLKNLLIRLADQMGTPTESGTKINYRFTHEEMAYMINSTRSTVTKKLSELEEKKVISYENKFIIVHNTQIKK